MSLSREPGAPARLGRFTILRSIGRGGMGEVYLAEEALTGGVTRRVAVKVLGALGSVNARRFEREQALLARISHPNVVRGLGPLEVDAKSGATFFPMEFVLGRSLAEVLAARGPLPPREAALLLADLARALEAAHACGVVHRDVKPSNALVDRDGRVRLTDFGIGRVLDESRVTAAGQTLGTPAYMSPEQASGADAGPASDLYGLGTVGYELVTGRPPFRAESPLAILRMHIDVAPRPPGELAAEAAPRLERLILRLLAKAPAERGTAAAARAELEAIAAEPGGAEHPGGDAALDTRPLATLATVAPRGSLRPAARLRTALIGAATLGFAAGAYLVAGVPRDPPPPPVQRPGPRPAVVRLNDGRVLAGDIAAVEGGVVRVRTTDGRERAFPLGEVRAIDYEATTAR